MKMTKRILLIVTGFAALSAAFALVHQPGRLQIVQAAGQKILGGPYVVGVSTKSATVAWLVQAAEVTFRPPNGAAALTAPALRVESTTLTGLQPDTRYEFNIGSSGDEGKGSFKTAPSSVEAPYRFVVYGDNRTRPDVHAKVIGELLNHGVPDFVVQTGDMVADGNDSSLWPEFFSIERDLLRRSAFFPALGNHERNSRNFYSMFRMDAPYYSFNWGNSHFLVLNSDIANAEESITARDQFWSVQRQWIEDDLRNTQNVHYRFIVAHHPPYTAVTRRQGDNPHMTALGPLLEKYHVSAGFFGHDHNYQHYLKNGIHYVTTGGGGAPLYDVDTPPAGITQKVASIENFVTVSVNKDIAHVKAIAIDGKTLDEFDITGAMQH
jgi:hypothetical protein